MKGNTKELRQWNNLVLVSILLAIALLRLRLLDFPLERDEGEYAYIGQLILQGIPPYKIAYNMKLPGVYFSYALIMKIFGETLNAIHIGLTIINLISILLVFRLSSLFFSKSAALYAALVYGLLSTSSTVLGFAAHATHFVVLMSLIGTWFLLLAQKKMSYILYGLSGLFFGISFIMKQHALFFVLFGLVFTFFKTNTSYYQRLKNIICIGLGALCPVVALFIAMYSLGVFEKFWFWTTTYALSYENQMSVRSAAGNFVFGTWYILKTFFGVWLIALVGLIYVIKQKVNKEKTFIILFTIFSSLSVLPGFYFRPHYFISMLPAIAMLSASAFEKFAKPGSSTRIFTYGSIIISISTGILLERDYFFLKDTTSLSYQIYGAENSFPESLSIAKDIQHLTKGSSTIFVFGSEPQIYFYSERKSATGYLYMYPFKEKHANNLVMQNEMIDEVEEAKPDLIVYHNTIGSWGTGSKDLQPLFDWFKRFSKEYYKTVKVLRIVKDKEQHESGKNKFTLEHKPEQSIQILIRQ